MNVDQHRLARKAICSLVGTSTSDHNPTNEKKGCQAPKTKKTETPRHDEPIFVSDKRMAEVVHKEIPFDKLDAVSTLNPQGLSFSTTEHNGEGGPTGRAQNNA